MLHTILKFLNSKILLDKKVLNQNINAYDLAMNDLLVKAGQTVSKAKGQEKIIQPLLDGLKKMKLIFSKNLKKY